MKMTCFCDHLLCEDKNGGSGLRMFGMIPNVQENIGKCITDDDKTRLWSSGVGREGPMQSGVNWENNW